MRKPGFSLHDHYAYRQCLRTQLSREEMGILIQHMKRQYYFGQSTTHFFVCYERYSLCVTNQRQIWLYYNEDVSPKLRQQIQHYVDRLLPNQTAS